jgi:hypothetical protein
MKYSDIIDFFSEIERHLSGNMSMYHKSTLTHDIEISIFINTVSGRTHKNIFKFPKNSIIYSSSIVNKIREQYGLPKTMLDVSGDTTNKCIKFIDKEKRNIIRFIDSSFIIDITYFVKYIDPNKKTVKDKDLEKLIEKESLLIR